MKGHGALRLLPIIGAALSSAGCTQGENLPAHPTDQASARQQILDRIASECELPRSTFRLVNGGLHVSLQPDSSLERVDCGLRKLRENRLTSGLPMGFVGNEAFSETNAQAN